jgi:hypothetical protein
VLDLASIKSYAAFPLHDPERLVIDVTGEGGITAESQASSLDSGTQPQQGNTGENKTDPKAEPYSQTTPVQTPTFKNYDDENCPCHGRWGSR